MGGMLYSFKSADVSRVLAVPCATEARDVAASKKEDAFALIEFMYPIYVMCELILR